MTLPTDRAAFSIAEVIAMTGLGRDKVYGLIRNGDLAGAPLFLELKAPGRKLSPAQTECHAALRRAGAQIETVDNIDAALAFLARVGVMR
jgi:hypothetical protein